MGYAGPDFQDWEKLDIPKDRLMAFKKLVQTIAKVTGTSIHDIVKDLDDSFYNLGGTSLNSLTVISELRKLKYYICKSKEYKLTERRA